MRIKDEFLLVMFYLKLCWDQAYSYLGYPLKVLQLGLMVSANVGIFQIITGGEFNYIYICLIGTLGVLALVLFGHFIIKYKIMQKEISFKNKYNPELMAIYNNTNDK